jgi:hypothetical protein
MRDYQDENKLYIIDSAYGTIYHANADLSGADVFYKSKTGSMKSNGVYITECIKKRETHESELVIYYYNFLSGREYNVTFKKYLSGMLIYGDYIYVEKYKAEPEYVGKDKSGYEVYKHTYGEIYRLPLDGNGEEELVAKIDGYDIFTSFIRDGVLYLRNIAVGVGSEGFAYYDSSFKPFAVPLDGTGMVYTLEEYANYYGK